jgi:hypothetical protein
MDAMGTPCMLFTLIYSLALWMFLFLMVVSLCVCIELPPTKRRRTLASTIVSGALNAALIGTAVGLTVYRLYVLSFAWLRGFELIPNARWRDRGSVPELEPPPYEQGDWAPSEVGIFPLYHVYH